MMILLLLVLTGIIAYYRIAFKVWSAAALALLLIFSFFGQTNSTLLIICWAVWLAIVLPLNIAKLRRKLITRHLYTWFKKIMPAMTPIERETIVVGTVGWEGELFDGKPDWNKLLNIPAPTINAEEQAFIDGPLEELRKKSNAYGFETNYSAATPPELLQFQKDHGFFGLIIPKEYGGKYFSLAARSQIFLRTGASGGSGPGGDFILANMLGPTELLVTFGTKEQKEYYLPRFAKGLESPCFALTSPEAGSDAAGIVDTGIVCRGGYEGKEVLGIRLNFNKRYITMAPVATIIGLAFKLYDPDKLLSDNTEPGITFALVPRNTKGLMIGRRHYPIAGALYNGPIQGKDVFIPIDNIIGGPKMAGRAWSTLTGTLATARSIFPMPFLGSMHLIVALTGAYARIRKQFNQPIGKFDGIAQILGRMGGNLYLMQSGLQLNVAMAVSGEKPAVLFPMLKYHATERGRMIIDDAMDILGGKAVQQGPRNFIAGLYKGVPVAITAEGANIMTRNLIIFGQGAIRCHRYVLAEMDAVADADTKQGEITFDETLFKHTGNVISNMVRAFVLGVTNAYFVKTPVKTKATKRYYQQFTRMCAAFAVIADFTMMLLGGKLRQKECISARLGDIFSYLYLVSSILKRFENDGKPDDELPFVHWACQEAFYQIQNAFDALLQNYPSKLLAVLLRIIIFPLGRRFRLPPDKINKAIADVLMSPTSVRARLTAGVFKGGLMAVYEDALQKVIAAEPAEEKIHKAAYKKLIKGHNFEALTQAALQAGIINQEEADKVFAASKARYTVTAVDDFDSVELQHKHVGEKIMPKSGIAAS